MMKVECESESVCALERERKTDECVCLDRSLWEFCSPLLLHQGCVDMFHTSAVAPKLFLESKSMGQESMNNL